MTRQNARRIALIAGVLALACGIDVSPVSAQVPDARATGKDPFVGVWKSNPEKTKFERPDGGPPPARLLENLKTNHIVIRSEGDGLRQDHYRQGLDQPLSDSKRVIWDGKEIPNGNGVLVPDEEANLTVAYYWRPDARLFVRLMGKYASAADKAAHRNFQRTEWVNWVVSEDGKTLVLIAWNPGTPAYSSRQVFDYQPDARMPGR